MDPMYASEKFAMAARSLAVSTKTIQGRIADVFMFHLSLPLGSEGRQPNNGGDIADLVSIEVALQSYENQWGRLEDPDREGLIPVWSATLSDEEASEIARWVVASSEALERISSEMLKS